MHDCARGYTHARAVNICAWSILETELRLDRKLQEANVGQGEGDGKLRASQLVNQDDRMLRAAAHTIFVATIDRHD